jgi:hypothetical protein
MSNVYHSELKIAFLHVPKCAGTSISRELLKHGFVSAEDGQWYDTSYQQLQRKIKNIDEYTVISTIRNPVDWCVSGYKMCNYWDRSLEEHMLHCITPRWVSDDCYKDWYWHCAILPNTHIPKTSKVFKIEQLDKLKLWFEERLNTTLNIPWINQRTKTVPMTENELMLIKKFTRKYAERFNYDY